MIISLDLVAGRFLGLISIVRNGVSLGTEMSALAFLARLGADDNPENTILTCFFSLLTPAGVKKPLQRCFSGGAWELSRSERESSR